MLSENPNIDTDKPPLCEIQSKKRASRERTCTANIKNSESSMIGVMSHSLWVPIAGLLDAEHLTKNTLKQKTSMNETTCSVLCAMSFNTRVYNVHTLEPTKNGKKNTSQISLPFCDQFSIFRKA